MTSNRTFMTAYGIDDVPVGIVRSTRSCCFEVQLPDGMVWLTPEAVHSVAGNRLTLVCMAAGARTYSCLLHSAVTAPSVK